MAPDRGDGGFSTGRRRAAMRGLVLALLAGTAFASNPGDAGRPASFVVCHSTGNHTAAPSV